MSGEELGKKLDKLLKQSEEQLQKLNSSSKQLRAHVFGQDRYWRRYWELPCAGGIFVEAMESAEPEILDLQAELDEKYKDLPVVEEKVEGAKNGDAKMDVEENRENEAPNEVKEESKKCSRASDEESELKTSEDKPKQEVEESNVKKELNSKGEIIKEESKNEMSTDEESAKTEEIKQESNKDEAMEIDGAKTEEIKREKETSEIQEDAKTSAKIEEKPVEAIPNGDKFAHVNNIHKDHNGTLMPGKFLPFVFFLLIK